jgi:cytoskeletal protein RodZ
MKKMLFILGGLVIISLGSPIAWAQDVNTYPNTAPEDAAKINDIQGQVNSSYFQNNSLRQDATGVNQNAEGTANLLKNSTDQQTIQVTGPVPSPDNATNDSDIPVFGLIIFLLIMIAPIVLIINMLRSNKLQTNTEPESKPVVAETYSQQDEDITEAQLAEIESEENDTKEEDSLKKEEPVEKIKKEVKKKPAKKSKKKSKKKRKK